ncbi:protein kinase [Singulisphaera sp. Ch08]|uniref:Protein kinase n=1 Tax=Singulisphaera sp. Ch08 TaxID=3120278 RepID=A0AAU7CB44_9BACT
MASSDTTLDAIFCGAIEVASPEGRAAYITDACGPDEELRRRVERLVDAHFQAGSFLEVPPASPTILMASASPAERIGTDIGPYRLLQQIGEGGMGTVYMAEQDRPVRRKVALKVIKAGMDSRQVVARFEAERQALALMDHVNIARVLDAGATDSGHPYFVMELVHGVPITQYCDNNRLTLRQRLELFVPVCQAIQHAHQKGIIHRDIKPSNVLVTLYDGQPVPKVIDFGVAKAIEQKLTERTLFTQYGTLVGTLEYMSPEQAEMSALGVDTRSDIYSLGVLLYELLTGSTPLIHRRMKQAAFGEILRMIKEEESPRPSNRLSASGAALASISASRNVEPAGLTRLVRGELDWIVMKSLEKDRNRRYETASGFAADVRRYLMDEPVLACPPSAWYRFRKFARRNRSVVAAAAAMVLAVVVALAGLATSTLRIASEQRATAKALRAETRAKDELARTVERVRRDAYFHRIALAHRELSADNLGPALELLGECPRDLREWEWHYLMRLCRVEPVILRDTTEVKSLAFSPDGESLASAGGDGAVKVWSIRSGRVIRAIGNAHTGYVSSIAFHPDGKHLASVGADEQVKVWDLTTGHAVFTRPCGPVHVFGTAYAAAFSPDGRQLAAGYDGAAKTWDWRNNRPLHTFPGHEKRPISVAFSRDGRYLTTGSWRGSVRLWDAEAGGEPLHTFPESRDARHPVTALTFSPDGARLVSASFNRRLDVWDTTTGGLLRTLPHSGLVLGAAFSPDGQRLASVGEDKTVRVWDATTRREVIGLRGHTGVCECVAFSPDGGRLVSASKDGTIRVWDATPLQGHEGRETLTFTQHRNEVWSLAVSPNGQEVVSAGFNAPAKVWDPKTGRVGAEFNGHRDIVFCVAWRPDAQRIASAGADGGLFTVKVWDPKSRREDYTLKCTLPGNPEFFAVAFSPDPDGRYLVTGRGNGKVQVWDGRTGRPVGTLGTHEQAIRGVVFSRDGRHLASASSDGAVKLWDATRLDEPQVARITLPARVQVQCLNVAFSPDGQRLATAGEDNTVKLWDVQTGYELRTLRGHSGEVCTVAFSPGPGRWIASAGEGGTVKIRDSHTGELLRSFRGHTGLVSSVAFSPDGQSLISGSRDHTVKVWDVTRLGDVPDR